MNGGIGEPLAGPDEVNPGDQPVRLIRSEAQKAPEQGIALCLSGGGYRAMLFHAGVLWRLNEASMLTRLDRVSSVSGGSISAGVLAMNWKHLDFDQHGVAQQFVPQVVEPIRGLAGENVDVTSVLVGIGLPFTSISDRVVKAYRKHLFGKTTLQDLPEKPRFVINATNLESGVLMRFSKPYLADYRVGRVNSPDLPLAVAVAASSAFPPFLSPCTVDLRHEDWVPDAGTDLTTEEFRGEIRLSDGGVYDNLGLETAWKRYSTILVSDAGGHMGADAEPPGDWLRHTLRVLEVIDNQVRSLRKRQVIEGFKTGARTGVYFGIRSNPLSYPLADPIPVDRKVTRQLAAVATRLDAMDDGLQEHLINWGYAICDTGLRAHVTPGRPPGRLPYPDSPLDQKEQL
ncbi:MAG: patatin-like phospholipase family protein [Nocardioidaceae bacterium]